MKVEVEATEWEEEALGWKGAAEGTKAGAEEEEVVVGGLKVAGGVAEKASGV